MRKEIHISNNVLQALIIIVLVIVVAFALYLKHGQKATGALPRPVNNSTNNAVHSEGQVNQLSSTGKKMDALKNRFHCFLTWAQQNAYRVK